MLCQHLLDIVHLYRPWHLWTKEMKVICNIEYHNVFEYLDTLTIRDKWKINGFR